MDTANYLYECLKNDFRVFKYGSKDANATNKQIIKENFDASYKYKQKNDYDILIATDAISEGYNLHRAGTIFNYDIPYNPTRVIQRVGRINRIDKKVFDELYIFNYFPTSIGEEETRTKQISSLKLAVIQAILGEDTKILSSDEELKAFYTEQYNKENNKNEQISWDAYYLDFYNKIKKNNPELLQSAINLPYRTRIKRKNKKTNQLIVFGKKGKDFTFKMSQDGENVINMSIQDAISAFEATITEDAFNVSENFDRIYQIIRNNLFIKKTEVPNDKGRRLTISKLNVLKKIFKKDQDYLEDLISAVKGYDALPDCFNKLIRDIDEHTLENDYENLKNQIPHNYLIKIIQTANAVNEGKELLILSEEFE